MPLWSPNGPLDYKGEKEAFVAGLTGSTIGHINLVSLNALASVVLYNSLAHRIPNTSFFLSFLLLIIPLLLSVTLYANQPLVLVSILLALAGLVSVIPAQLPPPPLSPLSRTRNPQHELSGTSDHSLEGPERMEITPFPAVTTYRAHIMLMTVICILAVDFPVFPRSMAKCESFGVSIMDLGVGSFVFSQGLVSSVPVLKNASYITQNMRLKLREVMVKVSPLLILGIIRVILVKGTEYPEHVSEYGTHWNFFLTLALLPPLQVLLHPLILEIPLLSIGLTITTVHQLILSKTHLGLWSLEGSRTNIVSHNKEGLVSIPGYLAIHILGLLTGTLALPNSPSAFRRQLKTLSGAKFEHEQEVGNDTSRNSLRSGHAAVSRSESDSRAFVSRKDDKLAIEIFSYAVLWWCLLGVAKFFELGTNVSRRLANLQYVLWVVAYNTSFLLGYILIDLAFLRSSKVHATGVRAPPGGPLQCNAPVLLEAINKNGLPLFLMANLLTGIVNISMRTMYATLDTSMGVLTTYLVAICVAAWALRDMKLLKF